jgi:hypothetical protein
MTNEGMGVVQAIVACRLRCEAEAVAMGFPGELGTAVYDGCVADDVEGWSKEQYLAWCHAIDAKFGIYKWMPLYQAVSEIMGEYGKMIAPKGEGRS